MKKTKRMDMGGEVESRRDREYDDNNEARMERRRMKRGDMEDRRKSMMDKMEGYRNKRMGESMAEGAMKRMRPAIAPPAVQPTQSAMRSGMALSPPANQAVVGAPPPNMARMTQNAMNQMKPMPIAGQGVKPMMRGGGLARKGVGAALKGGGLARKGVGQALKNGGLVKANGVAKRGKTRGKMC